MIAEDEATVGGQKFHIFGLNFSINDEQNVYG
jgi:hypothetical protein